MTKIVVRFLKTADTKQTLLFKRRGETKTEELFVW